jgi:membrane protease YdiL (CAAX protease family)
MLHRLKSRPLVAYFVLAYSWSWLIWGLLVLNSKDLLPFHISFNSVAFLALESLGSFGPLLSALILVTITQGASSVRVFFRQLLIWRVGLQWYGVALFGPVLLTLIAQTGASLLGGGSAVGVTSIPRFTGITLWLLIVPMFLLEGLVTGPLGEEPGWRGYALAKLQGRYNALLASLILGILWSLWHLPLFFIAGTFQSHISFLIFAISTTGYAFLITWIYNHTRGSVLLTLLFHTALNTTEFFLPFSLDANWLGAAVVWLAVLIVVVVTGPTLFSLRASTLRVPAQSEPEAISAGGEGSTGGISSRPKEVR